RRFQNPTTGIILTVDLRNGYVTGHDYSKTVGGALTLPDPNDREVREPPRSEEEATLRYWEELNEISMGCVFWCPGGQFDYLIIIGAGCTPLPNLPEIENEGPPSPGKLPKPRRLKPAPAPRPRRPKLTDRTRPTGQRGGKPTGRRSTNPPGAK